MASVGVIAVAIGGRYAFTQFGREPDEGHAAVVRTDAQWRSQLSAAAYQVLRHGATEAPYSSPLLKEHRPGTFACAGCQAGLFDARTKYDSRTGWPSFWDAIPAALVRHDDNSLGMSRTELRCARCDGHLGHVFEDGPKPTGLRYCMKGVGMTFMPARS